MVLAVALHLSMAMLRRDAGRRGRRHGLPGRHHAARRRGRRRRTRPGLRGRADRHPAGADARHLAVQPAGRPRRLPGAAHRRPGHLGLLHPAAAAGRRRGRASSPASARSGRWTTSRACRCSPTSGVRCGAGRSPPAEPFASAGLFVVFEGGEGAGKSTQVQRARRRAARQDGREVVITREPGRAPSRRRADPLAGAGRPGAEAPSPRAEALLYAADRAHHVATVVRPGAASAARW